MNRKAGFPAAVKWLKQAVGQWPNQDLKWRVLALCNLSRLPEGTITHWLDSKQHVVFRNAIQEKNGLVCCQILATVLKKLGDYVKLNAICTVKNIIIIIFKKCLIFFRLKYLVTIILTTRHPRVHFLSFQSVTSKDSCLAFMEIQNAASPGPNPVIAMQSSRLEDL